jgi:hypothetical protein
LQNPSHRRWARVSRLAGDANGLLSAGHAHRPFGKEESNRETVTATGAGDVPAKHRKRALSDDAIRGKGLSTPRRQFAGGKQIDGIAANS